MSQRSVRRSAQVSSSSSASRNTSAMSTSQPTIVDIDEGIETISVGPTSPLSPTRLTRQQEKDQLGHLNDRLAQYIERVRYLETENRGLSLQIRNSEEIVVRERNNIRGVFEAELADARRLLDETAKDKARLQIESTKFKALVEELQARVGKLERELKDSETRRLFVEGQVQDLQGKLNIADNQRKHWEDEAKKLHAENADLRKQLLSAQKQLEDETLLRVDLENRLQSLREELAFNRQLYDQEIGETRRKRQTEVTEINEGLEEEYKAKLQEALHEMREKLDITIRINRKEIEDMYENKMQEMREMADRNREAAAHARSELKSVKLELERLESGKSDYDTKLAAAEKKIKDLSDQLKGVESDFYSRLRMREEEIHRLQDEIAQMMREYQDLMDTKIQLSVEIEAYRRLIEGEETRLHLSPTPGSASFAADASATPDRRGVKRRRVLEEKETSEQSTYETKHGGTGEIEVVEHSLDGAFVKLMNMTDKDIHFGGWILKREAGGNEVIYKFHNKLIVKANRPLTVYSANADATHTPPELLVMKNQQWPIGDKIRTVLVNSDDEEVCWRESFRSSNSKRTSYRTLGPSAEYGYSVANGGEKERCTVM